jgi:hypothetical protein
MVIMTEIFNLMTKEGLTPNCFYVLYCIKEKIVPTDIINKKLECKKLINQEWITPDLQLTNKSIIFTTKVDGYFKKSKKKTSKNLMGNNFMQNIDAYVKIFPNKKLSSGKYARIPAKSLENGFRWFFENYNYDWQTIFTATQKYVNEYATKNYEYMRNSQYFLRKQNIDKSWNSDLAVYCEYLNDIPENDENPFEELIV